MLAKLFGTLPLHIIERIIRHAGVENLVSFVVPENKTILDNLPLLKQAIDNAISNSKLLGYNNRITRPSYLHHYLYPEAFVDYDYGNRWPLCQPAYRWEHLDADEKGALINLSSRLTTSLLFRNVTGSRT